MLGATYDISDTAETVAAAMIAEDASGVNGAKSITTTNDGTIGSVSLSFAEADALLNGTADASQTGTGPEDVTVTGTISVSRHRVCLARPTMFLMTRR